MTAARKKAAKAEPPAPEDILAKALASFDAATRNRREGLRAAEARAQACARIVDSVSEAIRDTRRIWDVFVANQARNGPNRLVQGTELREIPLLLLETDRLTLVGQGCVQVVVRDADPAPALTVYRYDSADNRSERNIRDWDRDRLVEVLVDELAAVLAKG